MNNLTKRRQLYAARNLMSYPADSEPDQLAVAGIAGLMERLDAPLRLRMPGLDIILELPANTDPHMVYLLSIDDYEMADLMLMQKYMKASDKALILGGGIGVTAALAAKITDKNAVVVVEANAALHPIIKRQIELNGGTPVLIGKVVVGLASAYSGGTIGFSVADTFWHSRIGNDEAAIQVAVTDLAELCGAHSPSLALIDIEGAELEVLRHEVPACLKKLIVEIHTPDFGGEVTAGLVSSLYDQGFRLIDQMALVWVFVRK